MVFLSTPPDEIVRSTPPFTRCRLKVEPSTAVIFSSAKPESAAALRDAACATAETITRQSTAPNSRIKQTPKALETRHFNLLQMNRA